MSVLLEFAMFPTSDNCREGSSVSKQVAKIIDAIDKSGVTYKLTPMGTIVETQTMQEALDLIALAYEQVKECERVYSSLKFDIRHDSEDRLKSKIKSVESHLNREIKK
ncbi:MAG: MTH1187 family thiamine-binding protein [Campylobacterales bacterium]|nr:MTH1187 family thiamine-binding protein [Campylobacterales bacterium]